jgi:hypothetical protein
MWHGALKGRSKPCSQKRLGPYARSPFQGSGFFYAGDKTQGVALGWNWVGPLGLENCLL